MNIDITTQLKSVTGQTLHRWFEAQAAATPTAVAVTFDGAALTYAALNTKANQLAHHLRSLGVGPDTLVGMCVERSLEMVIGILGVLKAGGAYVPLDLAYPKERLAFMLRDAAVPVVLCQKKLRDHLPSVDAEVVLLDADWDKIASASGDNPDSGATPANLAYVIYTSGSTGQPKGVMVTHHNVVRLFTATDHWYHFGPTDVWTLFHSYAFDFSVWEIWGALLYGGRLVVVPYLVSRSPEMFYELLRRERVTVLNQTPSAFRQLIWAEASAPTPCELHLRYVIFGGEALELQSLTPWFERHLDDVPQLINMYGITETTVHVTYRPIRALDIAAGNGSVIGVPIDDLQVYVLDENLNPVPPGGVGEMYVSGAGLARGYLNRPELTAQRFITGPTGDRRYKSGDLARVLPDGDLEYLGRSDDQVKIRGFRIELGEIMSVLNRHPAVRESVVIATSGDGGGDKRLIAYVVCRQAPPAIGELRSFLQQNIPDYMVPAGFMFLEKLPLTPNGKVDRRALPVPDRARPELKDAFVAPQSDAEKILAEIWSEILEVQPVGIDDNFFELGGDSIRVIQILARAQRRGLNITLAQLFAEPTIRQLAVRAAANQTATTGAVYAAPFSLVSPVDRKRLPDGLDDAYPMIKLQIGMFYHNEVNPASAVFHDVFSFRITFPFVHDKLQAALQQFVSRHPTQRTSFDLGNFSEPLQLVHKSVTMPFTVEDLRSASAAEQTQKLEDWIAAEKYRPFDRTVAPLLRVHVQLHSDEQFQMIVSFHHVILDGWSLAAMLTEILEDYSALIKNTGHQIPAPGVPYCEYVALERKTQADPECRKFWADKLAGADVQMLPRWPQSLCRGGTEQNRGPEILIPPAVLEGLKRLAQTAGVPLKSVLQAAHYRVLAALHSTTDVISGSVTNGRPEAIDGERMIGLFLNTIPLRLDLSGGTWIELARQVFAAERAQLPHRRMPLLEIQQIAGGQQLFETVFDFVHFHVYRNLQGYNDMGFMEGHYFEANNFTLYTTFMLDVTMTQLQMHFDYDPTALCPPQIRAMCDYYVNVLTAMATEPTARYETFSPLTAPERQLLLTDWNTTQADYPRTALVDQLFEQQARQTPDRIAVEFGDCRLTYRELNQRTDQLAGHLRALGVGPGKLVGVYVERSPDMVIALLAVLKAGGAYIPLDPIYPADRLAFMIEDAQPTVLLTQREFQSALPPHAATVVCVDAFETATAPATGERQPTDPAYVIYTSGSTGKPKGVQIPHRAVVNFMASMQREPGISADDVLLAVTTLSFDIAGLELFLPLLNGARIVIARREIAADGMALTQLLTSCGATMMQATPVTWRLLVQAGWEGNRALKILCGGEALAPDLAEQLVTRSASLWNMYGPTETTIWSAATRVSAGEPVVIGKPIANTQFYVVNDKLQPVPIGVAGELLIGGDGLAIGYLNRPELTAEKFIPNPFGPGRVYRTGDLVRYSPDGNIEFLGRMDFQVKIRGFRIELGEIEAVLREVPEVRDAVVVAREDAPGDQRLVAYLLSRDGALPVSELRNRVSTKLPSYMVPAAFVTLEQFPLTPNGKVNRKALPAPDQSAVKSSASYVAPRTPVEERLTGIWGDVLGVTKVGVEDNFFELGGHSLRLLQVQIRLQRDLQHAIAVTALFQYPTIRSLAKFLEQPAAHAQDRQQRISSRAQQMRTAIYEYDHTN